MKRNEATRLRQRCRPRDDRTTRVWQSAAAVSTVERLEWDAEFGADLSPGEAVAVGLVDVVGDELAGEVADLAGEVRSLDGVVGGLEPPGEGGESSDGPFVCH